MKRNALAVVLGATALTLGLASCAQEDEIATNEGRSIDFRPAMASRATETNNDNLSEINVTAILGGADYFKDVIFSKNGSFFTSATDYAWPGDDSEISFYAYSPTDLSGVTINNDVKTLENFSPAASMADQIDFISAQATGTRSANEISGVPLTFDHRLSQIEVRAKSENDTYVFKISGVRIGDPVDNGSFDFGTNAWDLASTKSIYESSTDTITLSPTAVSVMGNDGNAMLLPQQLVAWDNANDASNTKEGAYLSVKLNITAAESGVQLYPFQSDNNCQWAAIPISTNWEPGKKYIYTLDFTHGAGYVDPHDPQPGTPVLGGPIKFTVTVTDWVDVDEPLDMKTFVGE